MSKNYKYSSNTQYGGNTLPTMSELLGSAHYGKAEDNDKTDFLRPTVIRNGSVIVNNPNLSATSPNVSIFANDNDTTPLLGSVPNILSATSSALNVLENLGSGALSATSSALSETSSAVGKGIYSATSAIDKILPDLPIITDTNNNSIDPNTKFYYVIIDTNLSYLKDLEGNNSIYGAIRHMISSEQIPMLLSLEKAQEVANKITKCAEKNGCFLVNKKKVRPVIGCVIVTYVLNDNSLSISKLDNIDNYDNLKSSGTDVTLYIKDNVERAIIKSNVLGSFKIESLSLVRTCGFELSNDVVMQLYTLNDNLSVEEVRLLNQLLKNNYITDKKIDEIDCKTSLQTGGDPYKLKYLKYKALSNRLEKEALSRGIQL
jgi:hypothetical protein